MLQNIDEIKEREERIRNAQRRKRIVARIIKSTYRNEFFENKVCEFDNPDSSLDLFIVIENDGNLLGPILNIEKKKKLKKEYWKIESYLGTLDFEIISKPATIKVKRKNQILFDIRNTIRSIQDFNKNKFQFTWVDKIGNSLVSYIENYIDSMSTNNTSSYRTFGEFLKKVNENKANKKLDDNDSPYSDLGELLQNHTIKSLEESKSNCKGSSSFIKTFNTRLEINSENVITSTDYKFI